MPETEQVMKDMDEAAKQAESELMQYIDKWSAQDMAVWWSNWYQKTGHKRLGRILVAIVKKSKDQTQNPANTI